jgi:hypothetical protein
MRENRFFIEHTFQPCTSRLSLQPPIYGVESYFEGNKNKYRELFLKNRLMNEHGFVFCG